MNFLAHIYLSDENDLLTIGNFIGDFVKGNSYKEFPEEVQKGIHLHRAIDSFTDSHEIVSISKQRLWDKYRHYAGVITDIYYDHFLASKWEHFHEVKLEQYTQDFYGLMDRQRENLPDKVNYVMHHMKRDNWLYSYRNIEGIGKVLDGMSRRTKFDSKMDESIHDLKNDYALYEKDFDSFFPELQQHCKDFIHS